MGLVFFIGDVFVLDSIWNFFQQQLQNNQLFSGGLILMIGGALAAYCRSVPQHVYHFVRRRLIMEIDILDRDPAFEWVEKWLAAHAYARNRARSLTVKTVPLDYHARRDNPHLDGRARILFTPAPGVHWLFFRGRLICLHRERPKLSESANQPVNVRESFNITIFSRKRQLALELIEEARELALPKSETRMTIHRANCSYWSEQTTRLPRPMDSVILASGVLENLLQDVKHFLCQRDWYLQRGIPYRRGYLLYGPPGTGKSSAIVAIASELGMDIATLSLSSATLDDGGIAELFGEVPPNSLVLIEDIDCAFNENRDVESKSSKLTFSGLLNAIDGVAASEGRILMATTNHLERLDPALIRPGRIDRKISVGYASQEQISRLFLRFFPEASPSMADFFAESLPPDRLTMSQVQVYLLQYADNPLRAVENLDELRTVVNQPAPVSHAVGHPTSREPDCQWQL